MGLIFKFLKWLASYWAIIVGVIFLIVICLFVSYARHVQAVRDEHQSHYSQGTNALVAKCVNPYSYAYTGEMLDCLYAEGFTLRYNGQDVVRNEK